MKIVHIEDFFHPNAGYQINILPKYMAKYGHEVYILTSELDKIPENLTIFFGRNNIQDYDKDYTEKTGVKILRLPVKCYVSGRVIFHKDLYSKVKEIEPDILYVHGNDTWTGIKYLLNLKKIECPLIMDSHMLEMASVNRFSKVFRFLYKKMITPIIRKNNIKIIRTQDDNYVKKCLGIPLCQAPWISVGSDTLLFNKNDIIRKDFRKKNIIDENDFVIIYTGKLDEAKGGKLLAETFLDKFESKYYGEVVLIIVGNSVGEYGKEVDKCLEKSCNKILRFPTQKYVDLPKFYQSADLCIFPKQCSLSFYDAQACGLPVVAENNNINIDRLAFNNGLAFQSNSVEDFREKILTFINMEKEELCVVKDNSIRFVEENYNYKEIAKQYLDILINEEKNFKKKDD